MSGAKTDDESHVYHHDDAGNLPAHGHHDEEVLSEETARLYWRDNIRLLCALLAVWALVSFGFGVVFVEDLNAINMGGFKLGFWFAQQGSIYVFVVLIVVYTMMMKRIERRYGVDDDNE